VVIGRGSVVAAGAVLPEGFQVPPGSLVAGVPATVKRSNVDPTWTEGAVLTYIATAKHHAAGLRRIG
jgi:carbonic anhydrase/acetyltransferase-like protein (isoleucine patch superfamily)